MLKKILSTQNAIGGLVALNLVPIFFPNKVVNELMFGHKRYDFLDFWKGHLYGWESYINLYAIIGSILLLVLAINYLAKHNYGIGGGLILLICSAIISFFLVVGLAIGLEFADFRHKTVESFATIAFMIFPLLITRGLMSTGWCRKDRIFDDFFK